MVIDKLKKAKNKLTRMSHPQAVALGFYGVVGVGALFVIIALLNTTSPN